MANYSVVIMKNPHCTVYEAETWGEAVLMQIVEMMNIGYEYDVVVVDERTGEIVSM